MSETAISVLPIETCFDDSIEDGVFMFRGPFANVVTQFGVDMQLAPLTETDNPPRQIEQDSEYGPGVAFLRGLARNPNVTFNLVIADAREAADLGSAGLYDAPFKGKVAESDIVLYGVASSIAFREVGLWSPEKGYRYPSEYTDQIKDTARDARKPLLNCDPRKDMNGLPVATHRVETGLYVVGNSVRDLGMDATDVHGTAQLAADVLYVNTLHWAQLARAGLALKYQWEKTDQQPSGVVTLVLPGEHMDAFRKLNALGIDEKRMTALFATEYTPCNRYTFYQKWMERGGIVLDEIQHLEGVPGTDGY